MLIFSVFLPVCGCTSLDNAQFQQQQVINHGSSIEIFYSEFGALGDGVTDDFDAIIRAHEAANASGAKVCADPGAVYYIGRTIKTARIETDTDWTGAEFIIDDTKVPRNGRAFEDSWLFEIASAKKPVPVNSILSLKKNRTCLDLSFETDSLIIVTNDNVRRFIRRGQNQNSGIGQVEVFVIDKNGNIDPANPLVWNYVTITSMTAYPIDTSVLTINGGKFTTIASKGHADLYYMTRGIHLTRSNTVIDGLTHLITSEQEIQGASYHGFLYIENCANITVKNSTFTGHRAYVQSNGPTRGTYDFNVLRVANLSVINCGQSNDITDSKYWGVFTSNFSKNFLLDGVKFSRVDAHNGLHNLTILNSEFGHQGIQMIGGGLMRVENTKITGAVYLNLRSDYGSTWEGDVIIRNGTFVPTIFDNPAIIYSNNDGQWNFGYTCYFPGTITIDGFTVDETSVPDEYSGVLLVRAVNNGKKERYPVVLPEMIKLFGFQSSFPYRMPNEYLEKNIKVMTQ